MTPVRTPHLSWGSQLCSSGPRRESSRRLGLFGAQERTGKEGESLRFDLHTPLPTSCPLAPEAAPR
ncbi:hypothetical protein FIBSPDRAFT_868441 [Athelia psychrophila]|uniref:Uncharacterized protein n=1 Tax=Athelia psychrophila TaxID=1759441 RepID=A0A166D5P4_9AGAM|nr:hypothetical protein FIBSPDRAFT_868441 [Fibularhizoctonia sp. CBS 109695]